MAMVPRLWWVEMTLKPDAGDRKTRVYSYVVLAADEQEAIAKARVEHGRPERIAAVTAQDHGGDTVALGLRLQ